MKAQDINKAAAAVTGALDTYASMRADVATAETAAKVGRWNVMRDVAKTLAIGDATDALKVGKKVKVIDRETQKHKDCSASQASAFAAILYSHAHLDGFDTAFIKVYGSETPKGVNAWNERLHACRAFYNKGDGNGAVWSEKAFKAHKLAQDKKARETETASKTVDGISKAVADILKRRCKDAGLTVREDVDVTESIKGIIGTAFRPSDARPEQDTATQPATQPEPDDSTTSTPEPLAAVGTDPEALQRLIAEQVAGAVAHLMAANK